MIITYQRVIQYCWTMSPSVARCQGFFRIMIKVYKLGIEFLAVISYTYDNDTRVGVPVIR